MNPEIGALVHSATEGTGTMPGAGFLVLTLWVIMTLIRCYRILRVPHRARSSPEPLQAKQDARMPGVSVDVRSRRSMEGVPELLSGAVLRA
jgi:hypothetical protein